MAPFNPKSTSTLRSAMHYKYSIGIEVGLGVSSLYFYFRSVFEKNARSVYLPNPYIAIHDTINTVCKHFII